MTEVEIVIMSRLFISLLYSFVLTLLTGCETSYIPCKAVDYTSFRPTILKEMPISKEADIAVYTSIEDCNRVSVIVQNLTDNILTIDQTKSFFINSDQSSTAYYDPTVRTKTESSTTGKSQGKSFNLGGIANAFGIGGIAGSLMNATTVNGSTTDFSTSTYTEVMADMPQVSIGPRGKMAMSKDFNILIPNHQNQILDADINTSPIKFSVIISYSIGNNNFHDFIKSDFYCNTYIEEKVYHNNTNDALRKIIQKKPNATLEPWYVFKTNGNAEIEQFGTFLNYK